MGTGVFVEEFFSKGKLWFGVFAQSAPRVSFSRVCFGPIFSWWIKFGQSLLFVAGSEGDSSWDYLSAFET
jgi:hypothetical protein